MPGNVGYCFITISKFKIFLWVAPPNPNYTFSRMYIKWNFFKIISQEIKINGWVSITNNREGHRTKMPNGRAIKQNGLKVGRVAKQNVLLNNTSGTLPTH